MTLADLIAAAGRDPSTVGVVLAVNTDGTITCDIRGGVVQVHASPHYSPRTVGDRVNVTFRRGLAFTDGPMAGLPLEVEQGAQVLVQDDPVSDPAAQELAGLWWMPGTGDLVAQRATPAPAPVGGTLQLVANGGRLGTYDARYGNGLKRTDLAEQGSWSGTGPNTGLAVFGAGAFAALAGKTVTGARVTIHRANQGGVRGAAPIYLGRHVHVNLPPTASGADVIDPYPVMSLVRNGTGTATVPVGWAASFQAGTYAGLGLFAPDGTNAEIDSLALDIDYV